MLSRRFGQRLGGSLGRAALLAAAAALPGCAVVAVAGAAAGAVVTVGGAVVGSTVKVAGKVVEKTIDLVVPGSPPVPPPAPQ